MNFFDYEVSGLKGDLVSLSRYKGSVCLVVNTASRCGFTSQYAGLESLYQEYKDQGFLVLGFPSNDFASQEPGNNEEIRKFCDVNYHVTFPMFAKGHVSGMYKQPIYRFLTEKSERKFQGDPGWNFVKFLIDRHGDVAARYAALTLPTSGKVKRAIEALLHQSA